jgi:hypothetical protein
MLFQEEAGGREDILVIVDDQYLAESLFHRGDRFCINFLEGGFRPACPTPDTRCLKIGHPVDQQS